MLYMCLLAILLRHAANLTPDTWSEHQHATMCDKHYTSLHVSSSLLKIKFIDHILN